MTVNWFDNLKIAHKLTLGFGGCLALCILACFSAMAKMASINENVTRLHVQSSQGEGILVRLDSDLKLYRLWEIHYGVVRDEAGWQESEEHLTAYAARTNQDIQDYTNNARAPQDIANINALSEQWKQALALTPQLRVACRSGDDKLIANVLGKVTYAPMKIAYGIIDDMVAWNVKNGDDLAKAAAQSYQAARVQVASLTLLAVILSIVLSSFVSRSITAPIGLIERHLWTLKAGLSGLANNTDAISAGDFNYRAFERPDSMEWERRDEFGAVARAYDSMIEEGHRTNRGVIQAMKALSRMVGTARDAAETIAAASGEVAGGNEDLSRRTSEQATNLEKTAASMEQMTSIVKQSAENAREANALAVSARATAQNGGQVVDRAVMAMREINDASKKISDIVSVIDEIAFQTNLLALNAAVEAARVGEQGKGFAVVASEVRNLAGRSSSAAREIKALVKDSVHKVSDGAELVNQSGDQLHEIVDAVEKVARIIEAMSSAAQEQSIGIDQVNRAVAELDQITQQNAALVEEAAAASLGTSRQATRLRELVQRFKLDPAAAAEAGDEAQRLAA